MCSGILTVLVAGSAFASCVAQVGEIVDTGPGNWKVVRDPHPTEIRHLSALNVILLFCLKSERCPNQQ